MQKVKIKIGWILQHPFFILYTKIKTKNIVDTLKVTKISTIREKNILNGLWVKKNEDNIQIYIFMVSWFHGDFLQKNCLIKIKFIDF